MNIMGCHASLDIYTALKANHVVPNLVAHGDTSITINVSKCELPLVSLGCNGMVL